MPMNSRIDRLIPIQAPTMPSDQEHFELVSADTRAFLEATLQRCSSSEHVDRTELYRLYMAWCNLFRIYPVSARRLYESVRDGFRVSTSRSNGRRLLRGIRIIPGNPVLSAIEEHDLYSGTVVCPTCRTEFPRGQVGKGRNGGQKGQVGQKGQEWRAEGAKVAERAGLLEPKLDRSKLSFDERAEGAKVAERAGI